MKLKLDLISLLVYCVKVLMIMLFNTLVKKGLPLVCGCLFFAQLAVGIESFESSKKGVSSELNTEYGELKGAKMEILGKGKTGKQSLRIFGDSEQPLELVFKKALPSEMNLSFWAERWSSKSPFSFKVFAVSPSGSKELYDGKSAVKVGGFSAFVELRLPKGATAVRFEVKAPAQAGVMIDDLSVMPLVPMTLGEPSSSTMIAPVMIRRDYNPILRLDLPTEGCLKPLTLNDVYLDFSGTTNLNDIDTVKLVKGGDHAEDDPGETLASGTNLDKKGGIKLSANTELASGNNKIWVSVKLKHSASLDNKIAVKVRGVVVNKAPLKLAKSEQATQRIGYAVAIRDEMVNGRLSKFFRIPGMVRTKKGTLVAVYDLRYNHSGDLPADIDVGVTRSTDGGQTWSPIRLAVTAKKIAPQDKVSSDGCGDPAILVDEKTGRIWMANLWSHGQRSLRGSLRGDNSPLACGQIILNYSDDDGITWSEPINITNQVKDKDWALLFQGPGNGICMADGTLVFAAQYWTEDAEKSNRHGHSTLIYSKDQGKTWHCGTNCQNNTSEAQVIEQKDGSIMINARNESRSNSRVVYTTKDLGKTWEEHPTNTNKNGKGLIEPGACQASIQLVQNKKVPRAYFFSNPMSTNGRRNMAIQSSLDDGQTWQNPVVYDERGGAGYSALAPINDDYIGVLYEGAAGYIYFLRFPYKELLSTSQK